MNLHKVILFISNDPNWWDKTLTVLEQFEHIILFANNGREGLETAHSDQPDLIISESTLPDMSGMDFCQLIRDDEDLYRVPVILVDKSQQDIDEVVKSLSPDAKNEGKEPMLVERPKSSPAITGQPFEQTLSETYLELSHQILSRRQQYLTKIIKETSDLIIALNDEHQLNRGGEALSEDIISNFVNRIEIGKNIIDGLARLLKEQASNFDVLSQSIGIEEFSVPDHPAQPTTKSVRYESVNSLTDLFQVKAVSF